MEGIVGIEDPIGVGSTPPGEGKSGEMSGESSWKADDGGGFEDNAAGEAEIVEEALGLGCEEGKQSKGEAKKIIMSNECKQKEAIF